MKYYLDTEFDDNGKTIELISIALVCEDGRELYSVSKEFDPTLVDPWVRVNVLPHLPPIAQWKYRAEIRAAIEKFVFDEKPEVWGYYCVAPETRVLTADLRWVPIGSLSPGDHLVAFDEHSATPGKGRSRAWRHWRKSTVETIERIDRPCYDLRFDDGTKVRCSIDHRWLSGCKEAVQWRTTERLQIGHSVAKPVDTWTTFDTRDGGYLAAALDGEGWLSQRVPKYGVAAFRAGFSQKNNVMLAEVVRILLDAGFTVTNRCHSVSRVHSLGIGNRRDVLRLLGAARPVRLLQKFDPDIVGAMSLRPVRLASKRKSGIHEVVSIRTSTGTYLAEGLGSHNCDYDWVAFCQLFGKMLDLPERFPKFCRDLKQLSVDVGSPKHPKQRSTEHDALCDARWNKKLHAFLMEHKEKKS